MNSQNVIKKLTAIIVDDELHGRENLRIIIENYCAEVEILGSADSVVGAIELVKSFHPDVVFLDIHMPVLDGFDFLDEFEERTFKVVFVTAHEEFGITAVKVGATDYLLKPINIRELKQTIKNLMCIMNRQIKVESHGETGKLVLPAAHGFDLLGFDDLIRFEADGCYTRVFIKGGKRKMISRTLKDFEDTLPKEQFFRIHKSHLINLKYIKEYSNLNGNHVTMTDGSKVELSRRKAPEFILKIKSALKTI
jgi:two-component system LytT family response regulator